VAYTIDPAYVAEVREYLGKFCMFVALQWMPDSRAIRLSRKGQTRGYSKCRPLMLPDQDGYTMETLDIHGFDKDGDPCVLFHNVSRSCISPIRD